MARAVLVVLVVSALGCRADDPGPDPGVTPDAGEGEDASAAECDPLGDRAAAPDVFIGPDGIETKLLGMIGEADTSIDLLMYQLGRQSFIDAFAAAEGRGVDVRIILDRDEWLRADDEAQLTSAGVELSRSRASFTHSHAKTMIIDGNRAVIMSANMTNDIQTGRNYGVVVTDPADVADAQAVFDADLASAAGPTLSCTRLVVSPGNAQSRVVGHIAGADATLDMAVMYVTDEQVLSTIESRIADGVVVRVLLADPNTIDTNTATAARLQAAGAQVRIFREEFLHAKLVIADGVALVGSQNMSFTSLARNRELGLLVHETAPAAEVIEQFETDWALGETP